MTDTKLLSQTLNRIAKALRQEEFDPKQKVLMSESLDAIADYIEENGAGGGGNNDILTLYVSQDVSIIGPSEDLPDGYVNKVTYISLDPPTVDEIGEFDNDHYVYPVTWNRSNVLQSDDIMIQSYFTGKTLKIIYCYIDRKYDSEQDVSYSEEVKRPYYVTGFNGDDNPTYGNHYYTYVTSGYNPRDAAGSSYVDAVMARYDVNGETKTWAFNLIQH